PGRARRRARGGDPHHVERPRPASRRPGRVGGPRGVHELGEPRGALGGAGSAGPEGARVPARPGSGPIAEGRAPGRVPAPCGPAFEPRSYGLTAATNVSSFIVPVRESVHTSCANVPPPELPW